MRTHLITILAVLAFSVSAFGAEIVADPVADFIAKFKTEDNDSLLILRTDLNRDGHEEIWLSFRQQMNDGVSGYLWKVYLPVKQGFIALDDSISFRTDAIYVGAAPVVGIAYGLLSYLPAGADKGRLIAYELDGTRLIKKDLGEIDPEGSERQPFKDLFESNIKPKISVIPVQSLQRMTTGASGQ